MTDIDSAPENTAPGGLLALEFLLVFLVLFVPMQSFLDAARFTIFTARDLDRARLLAAGHLIFFGPEASAGSHLPGSFYYFLLAIPLKLGLGLKAVWELQFSLAAAGFALLWVFARRKLGVFSAFYALFCAAFFNYELLSIAYNASYVPLFAVAALLALCLAFDARSQRRGLAWAMFCLSCGLGLQFHFSFVSILLSGLLLQLAAKRLKLSPLSWKDFRRGVLVFLATLLPYAVWSASARLGRTLGQPALPFTGAKAVELWDIFLYAIRVKSGMPVRLLAARVLVLLPVEALFPLLLLYSGAAGTRKEAPRPGAAAAEDNLAGTCVKVFAVSSALTFFPYLMSLALSPARYAVLPRLSLDLLTMAVLARNRDRFRQEAFYPAVMGGIFAFTLAWRLLLWPSRLVLFSPGYLLFPAAAGLALMFLLRRGPAADKSRAVSLTALALPLLLVFAIHIRTTDFYRNSSPGNKDMKEMSRVIFSQTGWSYAEARRRIFYVNIRDLTTPSYIYRAVEDGAARAPAPPPGLDRVDGYFTSLFWENAPGLYGRDGAKNWILDQEISGMLKEGIGSGGILLGNPVYCGRLLLVPYKVADTEHYPPFFHNGSEAYSLTGPEAPLPPAPRAKTLRFTFNDCPEHGYWCDVMADVQLRPGKSGRWLARVIFSGEPLAQACDGINMQWNQLLKRPYLSFTCGDERRSVLLADSLGMDRDRYRTMNLSMLAPYERVFTIDCPTGPENISIGYESAAAYVMGRKIEGLPGKELPAPGGRQ